MLENGVLLQKACALPVEPTPHASQPSRWLIPDEACAGGLSATGTARTMAARSTTADRCALQRVGDHLPDGSRRWAPATVAAGAHADLSGTLWLTVELWVRGSL